MIWHFYVRYSYVVVEKEDIMTKKGKLRKGISILLAVCMALPVGFVTKSDRRRYNKKRIMVYIL